MSTLLASGHVLIGANISPAMAGMAKVNAQFARTGTSMGRTGSAMTKAIGLPIAAAFAYSIKAAADFESALNNMQAVSGATAGQMKKVGATAKALGADVKLPGTSAKDAADAMVELAKGGMTAQQAMDAARGTLMLAAAAGIENAEAATIQVSALNAFGLSAKSAGKVADLLAASANASTAEITDMAQSLQGSATVAHQAGFPSTQPATALSMLANAGIRGSDAGTSLKTMLMRLQAPMGAGAAAVTKYGLSLRDAGGELKSLPALAQEFQRKTEKLTKAQRDAAFAAIFGSDAIRAANILLGKSGAEYAALTAKLAAQGAAQKLAESRMRGFNGALEAFESTAQTAAITIGQVLLPMATDMVRQLTEWAGAFDRLTPAQQRMAIQLAGMAAAAGPALVVLGKLGAVTSSLGGAGGFAKVAGPVGLAAAALTALAFSSESSRAALAQMGGQLAPLGHLFASIVSSPVALWMAAVGAAAFALVSAVTAASGAMAGLTAAVAANPFGAFVVGAGLVLGAIVGITSAMGGGESAMQRFRDATDAAKGALDRLKGAALDVKGAQLQHQAAILEVKAAQQGLAGVQKQVADGDIKGKDATLALAQAKLRVAQANHGVETSSRAVNTSIKAERGELVGYNAETQKAISAAKERVANLKGIISATGGSAATTAALKDAQGDLARAMKNAGKQTGATTGELNKAKKGADNLAGGARNAKGALDTVKSKTVTITANTERAIMAIAGVVASLALVASKTITVTIVPRHVRGSWTVQETIENLRKEPSRRSLTINFAPAGTGSVENALKLTKNVIDAIRAAKANAADLAGGLAGMIGQGVDALTGRRLSDLNASSEAQQLRVIEKAQKAAQTERERIRLQDAIDNAETLDDQQQAVGDMNDWLLEQQRQALADQLAVKEQQIRDEADARKTAAERGLADLTDQFNRGLIKQDAYNAGVQKLLGDSVGNYANLGGLLGSAFVTAFGAQLAALTQQIGAIAGGPQASGGVGIPGITSPSAVQNAEQRDRLARALMDARDKAEKGMDMLGKAKAALSKSRADAVTKGSPGGTSITSAEQQEINSASAKVAAQQQVANTLNARAAAAEKALQDWNAAHRAKRGGLIGGSGLADKVPLLAAPGEGVLDHRKMDSLWNMAMEGRRGGAGGGSSVTVNVTVQGSVIGDGGRRALARDLAAIVAPELNRRVTLAS